METDSTNSTLALPYLLTEQRVAPSGEMRVLQYYSKLKRLFSVGMHSGNNVNVLHICRYLSVICELTNYST